MTRRAAQRLADGLCLLALLAITVGTGRAILITAIALPETLARAEAEKGL